MQINHDHISFSPSVRSLGVVLDQTWSFKQQVCNICRLAYLELRRNSTIHRYLSVDATKTLICAFVLSRIDYCNSSCWNSKVPVRQTPKIQNNAARIVFKSPKRCHVSPLLRSLHWLPITKRIDYKLSSSCFSVSNGPGPEYLSELLSMCTPSLRLRSASDTRLFRIPSFKTKTNGQRSFSFQAATVCLKQSPSNC